jgi:hypothetical protein
LLPTKDGVFEVLDLMDLIIHVRQLQSKNLTKMA